MHGTGNDYVLLDASGVEADWSELAKSMCDRHTGIGADGILLVLPSDKADVRMRMLNPDGSEAEMCGNGIRCLAKYALEHNIIENVRDILTIDTMAGVRSLEPIWHKEKVESVRVSMGKPELRSEKVPVRLPEGITDGPVLNFPLKIDGTSLELTFVSMGNPHAVAFIDSPVSEFPLLSIGPAVEHNEIFPNRVNFSIVNASRNEHSVSARVWERGAGETMACGTGACAIAVAMRLQGYKHKDVDITLPGGVVTVSWDGVNQVYLEGAATEVFEGEWEL